MSQLPQTTGQMSAPAPHLMSAHSPSPISSPPEEPKPMSATHPTDSQSVPLMMEPMGELDGAINSLAMSAKYNLTQMSPKQLVLSRWKLMRSWGMFIDTNKMLFPTAINQWSRRLVRNLQFFQSNYLCVFLILMVYCILSSPLLLLALSASIGAGYIITLKNAERPIKILGRRLTLGQQYLGIAICSLPLFYLVGAGAAVFWVMGASLFVIGLHGSIYAIETIQEPIDEPFNFTVQSV